MWWSVPALMMHWHTAILTCDNWSCGSAEPAAGEEIEVSLVRHGGEPLRIFVHEIYDLLQYVSSLLPVFSVMGIREVYAVSGDPERRERRLAFNYYASWVSIFCGWTWIHLAILQSTSQAHASLVWCGSYHLQDGVVVTGSHRHWSLGLQL